jgi:hypothetical protein
MSMLEVVAAVAILALVTATVTVAINFMVSANNRERRRLAALEMANRLVLMYLDLEDKAKMPSQSLPLEYADERFMYSVRETAVTLEENRRARERTASQRGGVTRDRIRQVTVRVWLHQDSQGREYPQATAPSATLSRLFDPLHIGRNPDAAARLIGSETGIHSIIEVLNGGQPP